jgi:DNA ligase D-like protein (predicted 3'-phosphoesterase)
VPGQSKLSQYQAKRDFTKTAEPSGENKIRASNHPRFVIQKHDASRLHYDLRLELDGVFKSWAVTKGPSLDPHDKRLAVEVEDHPLDYGDFEGTIPKGEYGGGTVQLWDRGYWEPEGSKTPGQGLASGDLKFTLYGERLQGSFDTGGEAVLRSACKLSLEGIVSKKLDAPYQSGRNGAWTKAKCRAGHEVVVGGWSTTNGRFRSLLVGVNRGDHFVYVGRVGTGYGGTKVESLLPRLRSVAAAKSPFTGIGAPRKEAGVTWTKPELVAEIEFAGCERRPKSAVFWRHMNLRPQLPPSL